MRGNAIILLPIIIPILAGIVIWFIKPLNKRTNLYFYTGSVLAINAILVWCLFGQEELSFTLWEVVKEIPIYFSIDGVSKLFAGLLSIVWLLVGFFSFEYMKHETNEKRYFSFYLITLGVLNGQDFAGNLVTMYVFYELMTVAAFLLVIHTMTKEAIQAGLKYLFYSFFGASMGLLGIFFLSGVTKKSAYGLLEFSPTGILEYSKIAGKEGFLLVLIFLMILGFSTKAGGFPFHGWLSAAHPIAPAPASAVLSGIITKAGVFCIIRVIYYIVGTEFIRGTWVQYAWSTLTLITIFMGSMLAYKEQILKKRLAYSTVSQVSYILFGLSLLNETAFTGALFHVVFHSIIKNALFLIAGIIIFKTGYTKITQLVGMGRKMPVVFVCFTIVSIALVGIPPTSGFVSKWYLAIGSFESNLSFISIIGPIILLISALLTAGYLLTISHSGFFGEETGKIEKIKVSYTMLVPITIFTIAAIGFGIFTKDFFLFVSELAALVI